jgi:hypothetical protein
MLLQPHHAEASRKTNDVLSIFFATNYNRDGEWAGSIR